MRKKLLFSMLAYLGLTQAGHCDTLWFPMLTVNPGNVSSVAIINNNSDSPVSLTFHYYYKNVTDRDGKPNIEGKCDTIILETRTIDKKETLMVDITGDINNGYPFFSESISSEKKLNLPVSNPSRGYLVVSYTTPSVGGELSGEMMIIDTRHGAAWGYRAINDPSTKTPFFTKKGLTDNRTSVIISDNSTVKTINIMPAKDFTTRLFVAPFGETSLLDNNSVEIEVLEIVNRKGVIYRPGRTITVNCVGAIDFASLEDIPKDFLLEGGQVKFRIKKGQAILYKLDYGNTPYTKGMVNNAYNI